MNTIRLLNNFVLEIIPEYALPVEKWYGSEFAKNCMEVSDDVQPGMIYDSEKGTFDWPVPEANETVLLKEKFEALTSQQSFLEDCIAELAAEVYT